MEFRWVAVIVLWTLLAGPIFNARVGNRSPRVQGLQVPDNPPSTTPAPR